MRLNPEPPPSAAPSARSWLPDWKTFVVLFTLAALVGVFFSGLSAFDFIQHLDRELHGIHCSVLPGVGALDVSASTGCAAALMSPYSSVLRAALWGGIPIALPGFAVYAFLLFLGIDLRWNERRAPRPAALALVVASCLPVLAAFVMALISYTRVHAYCTLCVGMYVSALLMLVFALAAWYRTPRAETVVEASSSATRPLLILVLEGALFVAVPVAIYIAMVPDAASFVGNCGRLAHPEDPYDVMVVLDQNTAGTPMIEVMDPLCPACRAFERRFKSSGLEDRVHRKALLFPLDNACNWMVSSAVHPGACALSEAVLCADDKADEVLSWAFEHQEKVREMAANNPDALQASLLTRFPGLKGCLGSPTVKARINRSLRWAVNNQLPLLQPQVFVDGVKLCDQDTDLGMDFALSRLLDPDFMARVEGQAPKTGKGSGKSGAHAGSGKAKGGER